MVETDYDELAKFEREKVPWLTAFNSISGLTSVKTKKVHREEANQKAKDLATTLYEPPQKVEKCRTQGKFGSVHVPDASERFVVER